MEHLCNGKETHGKLMSGLAIRVEVANGKIGHSRPLKANRPLKATQGNRLLKATQSQSATQGHSRQSATQGHSKPNGHSWPLKAIGYSRPLKANRPLKATQGHSRPVKAWVALSGLEWLIVLLFDSKILYSHWLFVIDTTKHQIQLTIVWTCFGNFPKRASCEIR